MAFCKFCGAPLADGQVCSCPGAQAAAGGQPQVPPQAPPQAPQYPPQQMPQYPPQGQMPQYPPQGQAPQYPPQGQMPPYPPQGQMPQYPPQGQMPPYPPQGQMPQYPPQGQPYPPQGYAPVPPAPPAAPKEPSAFGKAFANFVPFLKSYLHSPGEGLNTLVGQNNWILSLFLHLARFIMVWFALFAHVWKVTHYFRVPFGATVLWAFILTLVCEGVVLGMTFGHVKLMKSRASFKDVFIATAGNGLVMSALLFICGICGFIGFGFGAVITILVLLLMMTSWVIPSQALCPDNNQSGKFWALFAAVLVVCAAVLLFMTLLAMAFSGLSVLGALF